MKKIFVILLVCVYAVAGNAQNVGIGTTAPGTKLTVNSTAYGLEHTDGTISIKTFIGGTLAQIGTFSNHPFQLMAANGSDQFVLLPAGQVGINTASPGGMLEVNGNAIVDSTVKSVTSTNRNGFIHTDGTVFLETYIGTPTAGGGGLGGWLGTKAPHPLYFYTGNSNPQLVLTTAGLVGIGNSIPNNGGLVVDKKVGAVNAIFGSNTTGVAIESSNPGIAFNSYYSGGRKFIATGYGGVIGFDPAAGSFAFASSTVSGTAGAALTSQNIFSVSNGGSTQIQGIDAGYIFSDRTLTSYGGWSWYADGGKANLYRYTSGGNVLTVDQNGNMGIGTSIPAARLDVNGAEVVEGALESRTVTNAYGIQQVSGGVRVGTYIGTPATGLGGWVGTQSAHPLYFFTGGAAPQMTLGTDGSFAIGTGISSLWRFNLAALQNGATSQGQNIDASAGSQDNLALNITAGNGTQSNQGIHIVTSGSGTNEGIYSFVSGGSANVGLLAATDNSSTSKAVFGSCSPPGWAGYFAGNVFASGTFQPSDEKLKTGINLYTGSALSSINILHVKTYRFLQTGNYAKMNLPPEMQTGIMAEEMETVFPQLVKNVVTRVIDPQTHKLSNETIQFKAVNYTGLIPVLVKGMQEQQQEIEDLKAQIAELKTMIKHP